MPDTTLYRHCWTAYHPDGTDYLNHELEQKVLDAVSHLAFMPEGSLLPIAAVRAVVDWIEEHGPVEPDYEAASKILQSGDDSITSWLMWATTIVDTALGAGTGDTNEPS